MDQEPLYPMEQLIPLVADLSRKYTSNESSSISYETASQLMDAVLYCIDEYYHYYRSMSAVSTNLPDCRTAYQQGYQLVIEKERRCQDTYNEMILSFDDYECENYRDTIAHGLPSFFLYYDPLFSPQDTILTLDYPELNPAFDSSVHRETGIDRISTYVEHIRMEQHFLGFFEPERICHLLTCIQADYRHLYLDNICHAVLLIALASILCHHPIAALELEPADCAELSRLMEQDTVVEIEDRLLDACMFLCEQIKKHEDRTNTVPSPLLRYFQPILHEFAVCIHNGIINHTLENVLYLQK